MKRHGMKRFIIISKNTLFKNSLSQELCSIGNCEYINTDSQIKDSIEKATLRSIDLIFVDINLIGIGDDIVSMLHSECPKCRIVLITSLDNPYLAFYYQKYNISEFIFVDEEIESIQSYLKDLLDGGSNGSSLELNNYLTKRECEILKLIATGLTSKEIAEQLCISKNTVDTHRNKMLQKLDLANSASLVRFACLSGII